MTEPNNSSKQHSEAIEERETKQLFRLQILIDEIFALLIWRVFQLLPKPGLQTMAEMDIFTLLWQNPNVYLMAVIGIAMILIYWGQHNTLFGNLRKTNGTHARLAILQIVFLLLYMYSVRLGIDYQDHTLTLVMQSTFLALTGFAGGFAWRYARMERRLVSEHLDDDAARQLQVSILAEPLTAVLTIPFAFIGVWAWNAAWLFYPLSAWLLKRRVK
jgi:uncharacterized membrane protein